MFYKKSMKISIRKDIKVFNIFCLNLFNILVYRDCYFKF